MGRAFHTVAGKAAYAASAAAGTVAAFTPADGDSFAVRNFPGTASAELELLVASYTTANQLQVRSPALHDVAKGIHVHVEAATPVELIPRSFAQTLQAQDTLIVEAYAESALPATAETEVAALGIYYTDLPGADARLHMPGDIAGNIKYITTIRVPVTGSATVGDWGSAAINSYEDLLHANRDYAVLGYLVQGSAVAVALHGDSTSNYKVGGPASTVYSDTRDYFWDTSEKRGTPHIPVFNAADKSSTYVDICSQTASEAGVVDLIVAELVNTIS